MLNLTLVERNYLIELIRKDQKEKNLSNQFYVDADGLIQYLFVGGNYDKETDKSTDLCPDCNVYCEERFTDGQCK